MSNLFIIIDYNKIQSLDFVKNVMKIDNPESFRLPVFGPQFNYLIAKNDSYFLYPNEANKYKQKLQNSFQHGGISLEEMLKNVIKI